MNSDQLAARIYATEEKPFIPGYDRKSLLMEEICQFQPIEGKNSNRYCPNHPHLSQGMQNAVFSNGKESPLFLSQLNAAQLKDVGLSLASG